MGWLSIQLSYLFPCCKKKVTNAVVTDIESIVSASLSLLIQQKLLHIRKWKLVFFIEKCMINMLKQTILKSKNYVENS